MAHVRRRRRAGRAGAVVAIAAAIALATTATAVAARRAKPETSSLTLPLSFTSAAGGYQTYAATEGFYDKYGLSVNPVGADSTQVKTALGTGTSPLVSLNISETLNLVAAGVPIKVIGCQNLLVPFEVWAKSDIKSGKGLKGKNIGVTNTTGALYITTVQFLEANGVSADDVTFVPLMSVPNMMAALISGRIDAALLSYPSYQTAGQSSGLHKIGEASSPGGSLVARTDWLKDNRNTVEAYLKGNTEAWAAYPVQATKAIPALAKFLRLSLDDPAQEATVEQGFRIYHPGWSAIGTCTKEDLTKYEQFLDADQAALVKKPGKLIDNSYVQDLIDAGFYNKIKKKYEPTLPLPG